MPALSPIDATDARTIRPGIRTTSSATSPGTKDCATTSGRYGPTTRRASWRSTGSCRPIRCYMRFFTFHPTLTDTEVARFTTVDYVDRLALVATVGDRLVAVGRFDRAPGETEAEVAFVVADEYQHHGIGSLLLDELVRAGRQRGVEIFKAETLAENSAMLDVFRHAGFPVTSGIEYGTVTLRFPIAPTDDYRSALAAREATRQVPPEGTA